MKVGDLVQIKGLVTEGWSGIKIRTMGIVVRDMTMMCSHGVTTPYRMGQLEVLWNDGSIMRATYANLEPLNKINKKTS